MKGGSYAFRKSGRAFGVGKRYPEKAMNLKSYSLNHKSNKLPLPGVGLIFK